MDNCLNVVMMVLLAYGMVGAVDAKCFDMFPKNDLFLLTGTDLRLNCSLNRSSIHQMCVDLMSNFDVYNLSMKKGSIALPTELYTYHEADYTLELTVPNVSFDDEGTYSCFYGINTIHALKVVHVGEPPGEPENLTCVSNNFENLSCSFSLNKKPENIPTRWTMEFKISSGHLKVNCSESSDLTYTCMSNEQLLLVHYELYQLILEAINEDYRYHVNKSFYVGFNESIVKPNPLYKLGYNTTNVRGTVELHWDGPSGMVYEGELNFPLDYKIVIRSEWDTRIEWINNTKDESGEYNLKSFRTYNLIHLIPFTKYSVTVHAKPTAAVGSIYWSDPVQINLNTSNEVSEHTVEVTTGSYTLLDCGEQVCPVLYWKNPDRKYWYGPITGYRIIFLKLSEENNDPTGRIDKRNIESEPEYVSVAEPLSEEISGLTVTGSPKTVISKEESLKMQIMLINSEGVSSNFSEILIPKWSTGQMLMPKWVSVEMEESMLNISWHMDPDHCESVTSMTCYWCPAEPADPSNSQNVTCREYFEWETVNLTNGCRQETGYHIARQYNQTNVKYAVSLNTRQQLSGGMKWENYRFKSFDAVPEKPEYTVSVDGTTMNVLVKYRSYHLSEGGRPILYTVVYKECTEDSHCRSGDSKSKSENFNADFSNPWHSIRNLKLGSKYQIYVKAINRFGSSIDGDPQIIPIPKDDSSSLAVILGAVFGSLVVLAVVAVLVFWIKRKVRKYKQDAKITTPECYQPVAEEGFYRQTGKTVANKCKDDHDSGKGSDSPGSSLGQLNPQHKENGVQISETSQLKSAGSDMVEGVCNGDCTSISLPGYLKVSNQDSFPDQGEITDNENDSVIEDSPATRRGYMEQTILNLNIDDASGQNDTRKKEKRNVQIDSAEYSRAVMGKDKDEHTTDVFVNEASVDSSTKDTEAVLKDLNVQENNSNSQKCDSKQSNPELNIEESSNKVEDSTSDIELIGDSSEVNDKSDEVNTSAISFIIDEEDDCRVSFGSLIENLEMSHYKNPDEVSLNGSTCSEDSVEGSCISEETNMNVQTSGSNKVSIVTSTSSDCFLGKLSDDDGVKDTKNKVNSSLDSIEMKKLNGSGQSGMSSVDSKSDIVSLESYMKTGLVISTNEVLENGKEGDKVDRKHFIGKNKRREVNGIVKRLNDENRENNQVSDMVLV